MLTQNLPDLLTYFAMKTQLIVWSILGVGCSSRSSSCARSVRAVDPRRPAGDGRRPRGFGGGRDAGVRHRRVPDAVRLRPERRRVSGRTRADLSPLVLVWLLVPFVWSWGGTPLWSVFPHDVAYGLHAAFGLFNAPSAPVTLWPFGRPKRTPNATPPRPPRQASRSISPGSPPRSSMAWNRGEPTGGSACSSAQVSGWGTWTPQLPPRFAGTTSDFANCRPSWRDPRRRRGGRRCGHRSPAFVADDLDGVEIIAEAGLGELALLIEQIALG